MKQQKQLSELTLEELQKKKKQSFGILVGLGIVWIVVWIIMIVIFLKSPKTNIATLLPCFILPLTLLPIFINYSNLIKEIKSRG